MGSFSTVVTDFFEIWIIRFPWGDEADVKLGMSELDVSQRFVNGMDVIPEAMTIEVTPNPD